MSVATVLETVGSDVRGFFLKLANDVQKARQVWLILSSAQTRAVLLAVGSDAVKLVKDGSVAEAATGFSLTLDEAVVADIQKLIEDAKSGDAVIVGDLKALGIVL